MANLFDAITKVKHLKQSLYRNIVSLRVSENLFDDLLDDDDDMAAHDVLVKAEMDCKTEDCPSGINQRAFHYSASVEYPFDTDHFMESRYSDGSFPAWYGSYQLETTLYETLYWMIKSGQAIAQDWVTNDGIMVRERAVYLCSIDCMAFDLMGMQNQFPELLNKHDYSITQMVGKYLFNQKARAIIYPSARQPDNSENVVAFDIQCLDEKPKLSLYLTYVMNFHKEQVDVYRGENEMILSLNFSDIV